MTMIQISKGLGSYSFHYQWRRQVTMSGETVNIKFGLFTKITGEIFSPELDRHNTATAR